MVSYFYFFCLLISIANLVYLSQRKFKSADKYLGPLLLIMPVVILGYWIKSTVHTPEAATVACCFIYLDSTVLPVMLIFSLLKSLGKEAKQWVKLSVYGVTVLHLLSIWIWRDTDLYYSSVEVEETKYGTLTRMMAGPLKFTHYIFLIGVLVALITVLIICFIRKGNSSRKSLLAYTAIALAGIVIYAVEIIIGSDFTVIPGLYAIGSLVVTFSYDKIQSHDIYNMIGEKQAKSGLRGYCAFNTHRCMMGFNTQFAVMMPDILNVVVDEKIPEHYEELYHYMNSAIDVYEQQGSCSEKIVVGDKTFQIIVSEFSVTNENKSNGYLVEISDITEEQRRLAIIEKYNEQLSEEVEKKTDHIVEIQNSVVLGLANMVENRDDNTGGHVKRTSEVIKFLVEEIRRQKTYQIDFRTARDIVRAAPMHDLGKISIDSAILCKPGKLDDGEYTVMKTHAPKSGEIVKIILDGVEEQHFVDVSYNLARHHHERWDGKGYPEGLKGEDIPVEARIMAVADVYDALVSKRCYKEAMSFEQASKIMHECMGSQFDPAMEPVFEACRQKLEAYYSNNE